MESQFVDTNIFLRHLTKDDPVTAPACFALFKKAARDEISLVTADWIIAEVVYMLSSKAVYNLPALEIKHRLQPILSIRNLKFENKDLVLHALDLFASLNIDFEDCLTVAHMERQQLEKLYSYDHHFDRVNSVTRLEPEI